MLPAIRRVSSSVICVAWIRHQRPSTPGVVEQPFDRTRTGPGDAVLHFLDLFGDVDMDRPILGHRNDGRKFIRCHRPQAVRRNPDTALRQILNRRTAAVQQPFETLDSR